MYSEAQYTLAGAPQQYHFYPRNSSGNSFGDTIELNVGNPNFNWAQLDVYKNGILDQSLNQNSSHIIAGTIKIPFSLNAGLHRYRFELKINDNTGTHTILNSDSVVCGDAVYLAGQSNSVSYIFSDTVTMSNAFLRTFGSNNQDALSVTNDTSWHLPHKGMGGSGIGILGMSLARHLSDSLSIPICLIQGAKNGASIGVLLSNPNNHSDMNTIFGRVLYRCEKAGILSRLETFVWFQGESFAHGMDNYHELFMRIWNDQKIYMPALSTAFIVQTKKNRCVSNYPDIPYVKGWQYYLAKNIGFVHLISVSDLKTRGDICHFTGDNYRKIGDRINIAVCNKEYLKNYPRKVHTTLWDTIYIDPNDSLTIVLKSSDNSDFFNIPPNYSPDGWTVECSDAEIVSVSTTANLLKLKLNKIPHTATSLSNYGLLHATTLPNPPISNRYGIGLPLFYNLEIGGVSSERANNNYDGPGGIGSFVPEHRSHLEAHFRADTGTLNLSGAQAAIGDTIYEWQDVLTSRNSVFYQSRDNKAPKLNANSYVDALDYKWMMCVPNPKLQIGNASHTGVVVFELGSNNAKYIMGQGDGAQYKGVGIHFWGPASSIVCKYRVLRDSSSFAITIATPNKTERHEKGMIIYTYDKNSHDVSIGMNGSHFNRLAPGSSSIFNPKNFLLGGMGGNFGTDAKFYELSYYSKALNQAEKRILFNYSNSKYNIPLYDTTLDYFDEAKVGYWNSITGIGLVNNGFGIEINDSVQCTDLALSDGGFLKNGNDFALIAHNGLTGVELNNNSSRMATLFRTDSFIAARLNKTWYIEKNDSLVNGGRINLTFTIPQSMLSIGGFNNSYFLVQGTSAGSLNALDTIRTSGAFKRTISFTIEIDSICDRHFSIISAYRPSPLSSQQILLSLESQSQDSTFLKWTDYSSNISSKYELEQSYNDNYFTRTSEFYTNLIAEHAFISSTIKINDLVYYRIKKGNQATEPIYSNTVGIDNRDFHNQLVVTNLNPSENPLRLSLNSNFEISVNCLVSIIDSKGAQVFSNSIRLTNRENELEISLPTPGVYYLVLNSEQGIFRKKIVIYR